MGAPLPAAPPCILHRRFPRTAWARAQTSLFLEEPVTAQRIVRELMATHHDPLRPTKGISGADPFVFAMAKDGGAHWTVVADEHPGSLENRKIPFVCSAERVRCLTFQQMMLADRLAVPLIARPEPD